MRYLHLTLIVLVSAAVIIFMAQNLQSVTVSFLTIRVTLPLFVLGLLVYVLGMTTGGAIASLLRTSFRGVSNRSEGKE